MVDSVIERGTAISEKAVWFRWASILVVLLTSLISITTWKAGVDKDIDHLCEKIAEIYSSGTSKSCENEKKIITIQAKIDNIDKTVQRIETSQQVLLDKVDDIKRNN